MKGWIVCLGVVVLSASWLPGESHAGIFGSASKQTDREDRQQRYRDEPRDTEDSYRSGSRSDEEAPVRRSYRESAARSERQGRSEEMSSRSLRRQDDSSGGDGTLESENRRHEREMSELERRLEEAEQTDNARKIKTANWMIARENSRHEKEVERLSRSTSSLGGGRVARRSDASRAAQDEPERAGSRDRDPYDDRRDTAGEGRRGEESDRESVSNPIRERYRRERGSDLDRPSRYSSKYDRDDQDDTPTRSRTSERRTKLGSNAARVEAADGPIRRY